ncbi:MAG: hypothetical protein AAGJ79_06970 [Verrucomicrobiota bacterium]
MGNAVWIVTANSTLFLKLRIDRLLENGLRRIAVEDGNFVYCRTKGDDFRLPLPSEATPLDQQISSGGFDIVEGTVRLRLDDDGGTSASDYEEWLRDRLQTGGWVTAAKQPDTPSIPISFSYFGDR